MKRNKLLSWASADYVSFIDDDDTVSDDYVESIYGVLRSDPMIDLVVFDVDVFANPDDKKPKPCRYRFGYAEDYNTDDGYHRLPNHLMVWRRSLCLGFEDRNFGEDSRWSKRMKAHLPLSQESFFEMAIPRALYQYKIDPADMERASRPR